jgi:hypothetical protein
MRDIAAPASQEQDRMSKVKSPQAKKELSLELDRRNVYGENSKASRKAIPRRKKIEHQKERRTVGQILASVGEKPNQDDVIAAELDAKVAARASRLKGFHKEPDAPLGEVVAKKLSERRARQAKSSAK